MFLKSYWINGSEDNVEEYNLVMVYITCLAVLGHEKYHLLCGLLKFVKSLSSQGLKADNANTEVHS
jgi:hypothetical protein